MFIQNIHKKSSEMRSSVTIYIHSEYLGNEVQITETPMSKIKSMEA